VYPGKFFKILFNLVPSDVPISRILSLSLINGKIASDVESDINDLFLLNH